MELALTGAGGPSGLPGQASSRGLFLRRRVLAAALLALMGGPWIGPIRAAVSGQAAPVRVARDSYLVRPGDTLWTIAERLAPGADPRPLADAIAEANDLEAGALQAGTTLAIPAR